MISLCIKDLETRLSMSCEFCGGYHGGYSCEEQFIEKEEEQEVVNIDYNSQLQTILDEFLISNQVSFEKFDIQCDDLVERAYESQKKLVQMETDCHDIVVEENPQVKSLGLFLKFQPMEFNGTTHMQSGTHSSLWWESLNDKDLAAWV